MRIFLTGGSGMVGKNFLEHPGSKCFEIFAPTSKEVNLLDYKAVEQYITKIKPDLVIHAAGKVGGIQANISQPVKFLVENLDMGRNIICAARETGVKMLLNLGSSCMYPRNAKNPLTEDLILAGELEPTNEGYALAKITAARLCEYILRENPQYQYKTLVPCNLYGRWDKFDPSHSHMIPAVIHKIHQAKQAGDEYVEIWGDGTARREFMYAADLAGCIVEAISRFATLPPVMNVGLGYDFSIKEYYETIARIIGFTGFFKYDLDKPTGMHQKVVDVSQLKKWGWTAQTNLEDGIRQLYKFYLQVFS